MGKTMKKVQLILYFLFIIITAQYVMIGSKLNPQTRLKNPAEYKGK